MQTIVNKLPISPDKAVIYRHFPFFDLIPFEIQKELSKWDMISPDEFNFIAQVFLNRDIKVKLDDVSFIYNYLKFLHRVSLSDFNDVNSHLEEAGRELWPLFNGLKKGCKLNRISIQTVDYQNIRITSDYGLKMGQKLLKSAMNQFPEWEITHNYLLELEKTGFLDVVLKKRSGNKINSIGTVIKLSVPMFINYLKECCEFTTNVKPRSFNTIVGKLFENIGLIDRYNPDYYIS